MEISDNFEIKKIPQYCCWVLACTTNLVTLKIRVSFNRQLLYFRQVLLMQLLHGVDESFLGSHTFGPHSTRCVGLVKLEFWCELTVCRGLSR